MDPQLVQLIIGLVSSLGLGALLKTMLEAWIRGRRERAQARGETPDARDEAAFYAEHLSALREKCLAMGMGPEDIGPRPVWNPPSDEDEPEKK